MRILDTIREGINLFNEAIRGTEKNFTSGSLNRAIVLLAIPMILAMVMESLFAVVDIYFVGKVSVNAIATVALTESVVMIVYAFSIGLSMAATALVARRTGEHLPDAAADAAAQTIMLTVVLSVIFSMAGIFYSKEILALMGGEPDLVAEGHRYTQIMLAGNITIMLLFINNSIFRGAGDASIAMYVLWISNLINIVLDPLFIFGIGPFPELGVEGAAVATNIGRGTAVLIQLFVLSGKRSQVKVRWHHFTPNFKLIKHIIKIALGGIGQYMIGTLSWLFLVRLSAIFGPQVLAGYAIAFRIIVFTILPSWGLSNAAATLVGQNLGAGHPDRAEKSVWKCAWYNMLFLTTVGIIFFIFAEELVRIFSSETEVVYYGAMGLRYICAGYVFFAYGMVIGQSFNGAGDTRTPTLINLFCFWFFEIPLAYILAVTLDFGPKGIFTAIALAVVVLAIVSVIIFRRGKWKLVQV